jgi:hypothetical protein
VDKMLPHPAIEDPVIEADFPDALVLMVHHL